MTENSLEVTAPSVDTQPTIDKSDRYEVETNITVAEPKAEEVKKPEEVKKVEQDIDDGEDAEPSEEQHEPKSINPRTAARKAKDARQQALIAEQAEKIRQYEAKLAGEQPKAEAQKEQDYSQEPKITDFEDPIDYLRADAIYQIKKERAELELQTQVEALERRAEIIKADKPDFEERVIQLGNSGLLTPNISKQILKSEMSADIAYHLTQYGQDLLTLRGLPEKELPKAMKAIEAFIKRGGSEPEKPRITQAKPPITPPSNMAKTDRSLSSYSAEEIEEMPLSQFSKINR